MHHFGTALPTDYLNSLNKDSGRPIEAVVDIGVGVSVPLRKLYDKLNCIPVGSAVLSHFMIDKISPST